MDIYCFIFYNVLVCTSTQQVLQSHVTLQTLVLLSMFPIGSFATKGQYCRSHFIDYYYVVKFLNCKLLLL